MARLQRGFPLALLILKGHDLAERLRCIGLSMEAANHMAKIFDPEIDLREGLWTYIQDGGFLV
jgi:hypothetical protein